MLFLWSSVVWPAVVSSSFREFSELYGASCSSIAVPARVGVTEFASLAREPKDTGFSFAKDTICLIEWVDVPGEEEELSAGDREEAPLVAVSEGAEVVLERVRVDIVDFLFTNEVFLGLLDSNKIDPDLSYNKEHWEK